MDFRSDFDIFIEAIEDGNFELVKLKCRIHFMDNIVKSYDNNIRAIHIASKNGNTEIVEFLLKEGSDVEGETKNDKRAIHFAAMEGHSNIVKLLIDHYCEIECETTNGERPIHYAARNSHTEVLRILIDNNCRLEPRDRDGHTPLDLAKMCDNEEIITILVSAIEMRKTNQSSLSNSEDTIPLKDLIRQNYVSTIINPENGKTLLDLVLERNDSVLLDMIKKKAVVKEEFEDLMSIKDMNPQSYSILKECIIYRALRHSCARIFFTLATPEFVNKASLFMGASPLEMAIESQSILFTKQVTDNLLEVDESWERAKKIAKDLDRNDMLDDLEERQYYIRNIKRKGYSRLHIAVLDQAPTMVRYMVENNLAPIDIGDKTVGTPLSLAYAFIYCSCVNVLQELNASANTSDRLNQSPLHVAIGAGWSEINDYLIDRMNDLEVKDACGFTVLDRARQCGHQSLCDRLIARGAKYNDDPRITDGESYRLSMF